MSEAESCFWKEKEPITFFRCSKVSSSFTQPFEGDATTQQCLKFLHNAAVSRLAPWKTTNDFIFVQSAFAVRQALTHIFLILGVYISPQWHSLTQWNLLPCPITQQFRPKQLRNSADNSLSLSVFVHG